MPYIEDLLPETGDLLVTLAEIGAAKQAKNGNTYYPVKWVIASTNQEIDGTIFENTIKFNLNGEKPEAGDSLALFKNAKGYLAMRRVQSGEPRNNTQDVKLEREISEVFHDRSNEIGFRGILQACIVAYGDEAWEKAEEFDQRVHNKFPQ